MVLTRTDRMGQQLWSSGADGPTRSGFNLDGANLEARAAYDDGTTSDVLPVTDVVPGRYFRQSFADGYALHRVNGAAWEWVGGSIVPTRLRYRRGAGTDIAWSTDAGAAATSTMTAGGEFGTTGLVRSVAGGSAGADLAADLSAPSATGRWYVRTRANGERGVVSAAHDNLAGPLFSAREVGGSYPWTVDSRGRMRAQAPTAFGAAALTDNVPIASAASATDLTAADLYGRVTGAKPALRAYRDLTDNVPIVSVAPDEISLGRASWADASIALRAPILTLVGALGLTGAATISGAASAASGTFTGAVSAEAGKVASYSSGVQGGLRSTLTGFDGNTQQRDMRHSLAWRKRMLNLNIAISSTSVGPVHTFTITPQTTCYLDVALNCHLEPIGPGSSGAHIEPVSCALTLQLLSNDETTVHYNGDEIYELTTGAFDIYDKVGHAHLQLTDVIPFQVVAGTTYKIRILGRRTNGTLISTVLRHVFGVIRESTLLGLT